MPPGTRNSAVEPGSVGKIIQAVDRTSTPAVPTYCTKLQSEQLGLVLADVAEWAGVETRLFRQAEYALANYVALNLVGASRD